MHSLFWSFSILRWQDIAEITALWAVFLYITRWCIKEGTYRLVFSFYAYVGTYLLTHIASMTTINGLLTAFAPAYGIILLFIHKDSIQQRLIPLQTNSIDQQAWPETVIQTALIAASKNSALTYVLEQTDALVPYATTAIECNAPLTKELIEMITTSTVVTQDHVVVITPTGKLTMLVHGWEKNSLEMWFTKEAAEQPQWIQDALFVTTKTDAVVFRYDPLMRSFTIISKGIITHTISAAALLTELHTYSTVPSSLFYPRERKSYVTTSCLQPTRSDQPRA